MDYTDVPIIDPSPLPSSIGMSAFNGRTRNSWPISGLLILKGSG